MRGLLLWWRKVHLDGISLEWGEAACDPTSGYHSVTSLPCRGRSQTKLTWESTLGLAPLELINLDIRGYFFYKGISVTWEEDNKQDLPTSRATTMPLIRCSTTLSILGFVPLLMTVRALAWVTVLTVAALSQGTPNMALSPPMPTKTSRSKWNPEPLAIFRSGLLMIRLLKDRRNKSR